MIRIDSAGYPVLIGRDVLDKAGALLDGTGGRFFLVTDENVRRSGWSERFAAGLGREVAVEHVLPPGEGVKTLAGLEQVIDALLEGGIDRGDHVVALGGGVVGDLAGFAAAVVKRGCGLVQVPTSLLAQVDSSVGGKTGVNTRQGKNLIGAFHRPAAVLIDPATLATLPDRELRAGYAEVVKYGLIADSEFYGWCEAHVPALLARDEAALLRAIAACVRAKAAIVARDEKDSTGERALLNFGHSFAHAIEAETELRHGEAVAIGMILAFRLSAERGLCDPAEAERVAAHLEAAGLPTRLEGARPDRLAARIAHDKKRRGGRMTLVLTRGIGRAFLDQSLTPGEVEAFLARASA